MAKLLKPYLDFRGCLNVDAAPDNLADNELSVAENIDPEERGGIAKRKGTAPLLATSGTCPDQTGMTTIQIKLESGASVVNDYYKDFRIVIVAGTGQWQVRTISAYDGTTKIATVDEAWTTQPDSTSQYQVVVNYGGQVEKIIEWPRKDGTTVLLAVIGTTLCKIGTDNKKTELKVLDSANIGYFFYADVFYFTGKESGTDKYWQYDGTTVSEVTPNAAVDNDLTPIKRCRIFVWHLKSQKIFAAGDPNDRAALYFSEAGDPSYFKGTSILYPTTGDGPIKALKEYGEAMAVAFQGDWWAYKGVDPASDATWTKLPAGQGTVAGATATLTPNSLTFMGLGGIYSLSPGILDYNITLLTGDELVKNRAKDKVTSIVRSMVHPETATAVYDKYNEKYMLAYGDDAANSRNNKILVLDWGLQGFTIYTNLQVNDFCLRANGDLLIATNGYILKANQGYRDWDAANGKYVAIHYKAYGKGWSLDYPFNRKKTKKLFIAAKQYDTETSTVDVKVQSDYLSVSKPGISLDESFTWGEAWANLWGWTDYIGKEMQCKLKGNRFQVQLENNVIDEPVTIYGLAFMYSLRKPKGVKV